MSKGLTIYLDSGANIKSKREAFYTWEELGVDDEEEWDSYSGEKQEEVAQELAYQWLDWGWTKGDK